MTAFAGGHSRLDAFLVVLCFLLFCVAASPQLQGLVVTKLPLLEPVFRWLRQARA